MLIPFFYSLNLLILLSGLLGLRKGSGERNFSLALVQALLCLPLLVCEYFYLAYSFESKAVQVILFSEIVFILIWLSLAIRLRQATQKSVHDFRLHFLLEIFFGATLLTVAVYSLVSHPGIEISDATLLFHLYSPAYFSNVFILFIVLYSAWRLEGFWRSMDGARRWEYKFLIVGSYLVCGALAWSSSYRLTYLTIVPKHLLLHSILLLCGWIMIFYAVVHHRLLNRKIFVSRKVIYSFVVPSLLAAYLLIFGIVTLTMRAFELEVSIVLKWLFLLLGLVAVGLFVFRRKTRRRIYFFISTHFYINKYEYRDEWLALSHHLRGASSAADVVKALREVLEKSLYTTRIFIWLGDSDSSQGFKLISSGEPDPAPHRHNIASNDPLVGYIESHSYFHKEEEDPDSLWVEVMNNSDPFLASLNVVLFAPISIGNQLVGLIGLGPEFTGGTYGHDDFDLLTALGSQTASALLATRMAEELAYTREQQAWARLSAFVLHDIKNAATMLSLLHENAPEHIHESLFQQDLLELVEDVLRRMGRVERRLGLLKDTITPSWNTIEIGDFLKECCRKLEKKLPSMDVVLESETEIRVMTDPELLATVLENLLLNAFEAKGEGARVVIRTRRADTAYFSLEIIDNGPGIQPQLLPDALFEPFKTSKEGGSGIGLWQVKRVLMSLGGEVRVENNPDGGARFIISLPLTAGVE
ncbi:MAG: XrtA/PEP-CTERM system histidine kinase PrsK [Desulforhopalus sp.]